MAIYYIVSAVIKAIIWGVIIFFTFTKVNPYIDFWYAVIFFNLGLFLILWSLFFLFLLLISKVFFWKWEESKNYKISFLIWIYSIVNVVLMFLWKWNKLIGLVLLLIFSFIWYVFIFNNVKNDER